MDKEDRLWITPKQAISVISKKKWIHTFRSQPGILIGADWERKTLIEEFKKMPENIEIGGEQCKAMGHGLVLWSGGPLFIEADKTKLQLLEDSLKEVTP